MRAGLVLLLLLAACTTGDPFVDVTRAAARSVVQPVVQDYFPGPQSAAITDCVINSASSAELIGLAQEVSNYPKPSTVQTVLTIAARPEAVDCITRTGVLPYLN